MTAFTPLREIPPSAEYSSNDVLVVFGELFQRGYANGIIDEAQQKGMKIIYSTVGRRDRDNKLRALNEDELKEKQQPLINIPLEAGFDLFPDNKGLTPCDQLAKVKLSHWENVSMDWESIEESKKNAIADFRIRTSEYLNQLSTMIPENANVLFVHTMAGGFPRAKVVMPAANRVFKGTGERYFSSEAFWNTDIGRFCKANFDEVTGYTLKHLIELSAGLRQKVESRGNTVSYVAYGYHGTEVLFNNKYQWQSYSPYLQGEAKILLEDVAKLFFKNNVKVSVFNAPEILTNSSSIFLGVEVALYTLLGALQKERLSSSLAQEVLHSSQQLLKDGISINDILDYTNKYLSSEIISASSSLDGWPQHNSPQQMELMRESSNHLIGLHKNEKELITSILSEVVFKACGKLMLAESWAPQKPVWWIGHDIVAKSLPS